MNWDKFFRVLQFLRITDDSNNLSLTNIALVAAMTNAACKADTGIQDVMGVVATVAGYQFKRYMQPTDTTSGDETAAIKAAVASLETKVSGIQMSGQMRR